MSNIHNHRKYTPEDILAEANMFLAGHNLSQVSAALSVPMSTLSWHLIYPLRDVNYALWTEVRARLDKYAKNKLRVIQSR